MRFLVARRSHRFVTHKTSTHLLSCSICKVNNVFFLFILQEEIKEALEEVCTLLPSTVESEVNV